MQRSAPVLSRGTRPGGCSQPAAPSPMRSHVSDAPSTGFGRLGGGRPGPQCTACHAARRSCSRERILSGWRPREACTRKRGEKGRRSTPRPHARPPLPTCTRHRGTWWWFSTSFTPSDTARRARCRCRKARACACVRVGLSIVDAHWNARSEQNGGGHVRPRSSHARAACEGSRTPRIATTAPRAHLRASLPPQHTQPRTWACANSSRASASVSGMAMICRHSSASLAMYRACAWVGQRTANAAAATGTRTCARCMPCQPHAHPPGQLGRLLLRPTPARTGQAPAGVQASGAWARRVACAHCAGTIAPCTHRHSTSSMATLRSCVHAAAHASRSSAAENIRILCSTVVGMLRRRGWCAWVGCAWSGAPCCPAGSSGRGAGERGAGGGPAGAGAGPAPASTSPSSSSSSQPHSQLCSSGSAMFGCVLSPKTTPRVEPHCLWLAHHRNCKRNAGHDVALGSSVSSAPAPWCAPGWWWRARARAPHAHQPGARATAANALCMHCVVQARPTTAPG